MKTVKTELILDIEENQQKTSYPDLKMMTTRTDGLPDIDIVIYNPRAIKIVAVISSKVTLRERIAQTGYWKLKLEADYVTKHIKVYLVTPDEDKTLAIKDPMKKGRAIVEVDLDGSYVLCENDIEDSDKVKTFDKFIQDLKALLT